jgi:CBS domain-containing protein
LSHSALPKQIEELRNEPVDSLLSNAVQLPSDTSLARVIGLLRERGVYEVFLPEDGRCGMVSALDVLRAAKVEATKAIVLMSHVPIVNKQSSVGEVARMMTEYRIRAVPVSDGRKIIGQVNSADLLSRLKGRIGSDTRVTSIAASTPVTVECDASCAKARDLMLRKRIDHLPAIAQGRLEGIITSHDIVSHIVPSERLGSKSMKPEVRGIFDFRVRDAMESPPLTCSPDTTVEKALDLILNSDRTYILVTQWEELQGIATYRDFITLLAGVETEPEVPVFIVGLPDEPFEAEATKAKFRRIVNQLQRVFPDILEARSVIKSKFTKPGKERGRYEVTVQIRTAKNSYTYSEEGWELPLVYDVITNRLKRLMTQRHRPRGQLEKGRSEFV